LRLQAILPDASHTRGLHEKINRLQRSQGRGQQGSSEAPTRHGIANHYTRFEAYRRGCEANHQQFR
jgi:hypothetical protein